VDVRSSDVWLIQISLKIFATNQMTNVIQVLCIAVFITVFGLTQMLRVERFINDRLLFPEVEIKAFFVRLISYRRSPQRRGKNCLWNVRGALARTSLVRLSFCDVLNVWKVPFVLIFFDHISYSLRAFEIRQVWWTRQFGWRLFYRFDTLLG
jgi:hypothetical protein